MSRLLAIRSLMVVALSVVLFSFSPNPGGDGFEVYLNNKLMIQQYGREAGVKNLSLSESLANDNIKVVFSHCGKPGVGRNISVRDGQSKILKEWDFPEATTTAAMIFKVKDILSLQKINSKLNLVYSSKEMPEGKILAAVVFGNEVKASKK